MLSDGDATNSRSEADYAGFVFLDRLPKLDVTEASAQVLHQLTADAGTGGATQQPPAAAAAQSPDAGPPP